MCYTEMKSTCTSVFALGARYLLRHLFKLTFDSVLKVTSSIDASDAKLWPSCDPEAVEVL